jgi:hypothetical protein
MNMVIILLMGLGLVILVAEPLVRPPAPWQSGNDEPELERLALQKETLYTAIRDLDFDYQTGKVDQGDYAELRQHLEGEALQVLRRLDEVDPLAGLDDELERQILAVRQSRSEAQVGAAAGVCPGCHSPLQGDENFCPACGRHLFSA